jgi:hypothetical protein
MMKYICLISEDTFVSLFHGVEYENDNLIGYFAF